MEQKVGFLHAGNSLANYAPGAPGSPGAPELGLLGYWRVLRKRRKAAWKTGLAVALLGTAVLLILPWNYQSKALLELNFATASPLDTLGLPAGAADFLGTNTDSEIGTEVNALQSEPLMIGAINDLGLFLSPDFVGSRRARRNKEDPTPWYLRPKEREKELTKFGKLLDVENEPKSYNVDVAFSYPDPNISQAVVNYMVSHYIESRFKARYDTVMQTTHWLTDQLNGFKKTVDTSQQKLAAFVRDHQIIESSSSGPSSPDGTAGGASSAGSTSVEVQDLMDLNHQLVQAQAARLISEAKYRISETQDSGGDDCRLSGQYSHRRQRPIGDPPGAAGRGKVETRASPPPGRSTGKPDQRSAGRAKPPAGSNQEGLQERLRLGGEERNDA